MRLASFIKEIPERFLIPSPCDELCFVVLILYAVVVTVCKGDWRKHRDAGSRAVSGR